MQQCPNVRVHTPGSTKAVGRRGVVGVAAISDRDRTSARGRDSNQRSHRISPERPQHDLAPAASEAGRTDSNRGNDRSTAPGPAADAVTWRCSLTLSPGAARTNSQRLLTRRSRDPWFWLRRVGPDARVEPPAARTKGIVHDDDTVLHLLAASAPLLRGHGGEVLQLTARRAGARLSAIAPSSRSRSDGQVSRRGRR